MKRSEVIRRLDTVFGNVGCACSQCPRCETNDDDLARAATALGIEVEPDEEPLPERLAPSARDEYGPSSPERSMRDFNGNGGHIFVFSRAGNARALLDALISAYNGRPRWRTGVPERDGEYIVMGPISTEVVTRLSGWWPSWATGRPWMPLPAAPK
jgi:hypothetical protein